MPRAFSMSIQSDTVPPRPALPCTAPAWPITWACRASASVSVDLPASGWLMTAKVRRRAASPAAVLIWASLRRRGTRPVCSGGTRPGRYPEDGRDPGCRHRVGSPRGRPVDMSTRDGGDRFGNRLLRRGRSCRAAVSPGRSPVAVAGRRPPRGWSPRFPAATGKTVPRRVESSSGPAVVVPDDGGAAAPGTAGKRTSVDGLDDIVEEFLVESHENLDQLDRDLVALEQEPELPRAAVQHLPDDPHDQGHQRLPGLQPARGGHARRGEHAVPAAGRRPAS